MKKSILATWGLVGATACAVAALLVPSVRADTPAQGSRLGGPTEYQVKAALLYNIAKFVEWPRESFDGATSPFVVCVIGEDPFERSLDEAVAGKAINDRVIEVRRLVRNQAPDGCHILFVSASEERRHEAIVDYCRAAGILTVGDTQRFAERGGVVGFYMESSRVRLAINVTSAGQAGLQISSRLLALAKVVDDGSR